jgi:uncharacterized YceG family protein
MADAERSAAEREAAWLERERRRAARDGRDFGAPEGQPEPDDWLAPEPAPEPAPSPAREQAPDRQPRRLRGASQPEPVLTTEFEADDDPFLDERDEERPLGTRRVARAERVGGRRQGGPPPSRPPAPRRHPWVPRIIALLALAIVIAALWFVDQLFQPFGTSPHGSVTVVVPHNAGARRVGDLLAQDGVVPSGFFFNLRATLAGDRGKIYAGTYHLKLDMSYSQVLTVLTTPPPAIKTSSITLIEGLTRQKIDKLLRSQRIPGNYLAATRHSRLLSPAAFGAPRGTPSLEGFLFPDTYQLRAPITVNELVAVQLRTFKLEFAKINLGYARAHHLTPYDVLIVASLVQAEAQTAHDFPLVASVIYNRLRLGMLLGIDATTRYAVGNYSSPLTESQLHSQSPWNTRVHPGLPPTPIDNPGLAAIQAAAQPAHSNYLYYVTKACGNGALAFASSYAQFQSEVAQYFAERAKLHGRSPTHC